MSSNAKRPTTLKQVAAASGVSVSTASRVLTGKAKAYRISESTERTVQEVATQLGFQPNKIAQSLRSQQTGLLGFVLPDLANPFFSAIAREITVAAEEHGFSVLIADSREKTDNEARLIQQLLMQRVEAIVVCPVGTISDHLVDLYKSDMPLIIVDRGFPDSNIVTVTSDQHHAATKLTELLTQNGHRSIGVLQGLQDTLPNTERLAGIREALESVGAELAPAYIRGKKFGEEEGYESAKWLIEKHPEMTAMISLSTQNSFGALKAASDLGLRIPDDLSFVSFDRNPYFDFFAVPISSAAQNVAEMGRLAAKLVFERKISGKYPTKKVYRIPMKITARSSVAQAKR